MSRPRPLVGIPANIIERPLREIPAHVVSDNYIGALAGPAHAVPMLIPAMGEELDRAAVAERIDGLFLTGGRANIEPHYYSGAPFPVDEPVDPRRDATALPLIRTCIAQGVPIFGVQRQFEPRQILRDGVIPVHLAFIDKHTDERCGEGFCRRSDCEDGVGIDGRLVVDISDAEPSGQDHGVVFDDGDRHAGNMQVDALGFDFLAQPIEALL